LSSTWPMTSRAEAPEAVAGSMMSFLSHWPQVSVPPGRAVPAAGFAPTAEAVVGFGGAVGADGAAGAQGGASVPLSPPPTTSADCARNARRLRPTIIMYFPFSRALAAR